MGEQLTDTTRFLMKERFGKDSILSLADVYKRQKWVCEEASGDKRLFQKPILYYDNRIIREFTLPP